MAAHSWPAMPRWMLCCRPAGLSLQPPLLQHWSGHLAALELIRSHPDWGNELIQRSDRWRKARPTPAGHDRGDGPVLPLVIGGDADALEAQAGLERGGLLVVAIRPPTVPEGTARLRLVLRRDLPDGTLERLLQTLQSR